MSWNDSTSRKRIAQFLTTVPALDETISLKRQNRILAEARAKKALDQLTPRRAFVVEGAHLYGELLDFDDIVAERNGHETESSQRLALSFLSMHYRLWDEIAQDEDANRVDYHGSRMHSVVTDPEGDARAQVQRAVALAVRLGTATKDVASRFGFPSRIRFGIDQGRCVAMTTGRAMEADTLFLGTPANHAAKIAAAGDDEGIFLTVRAQSLVGAQALAKDSRGRTTVTREFILESLDRNPFPNIDQARDRIVADMRLNTEFIFFRPTPPLADLKFSDLVPSHTARMGMASMFADVHGYTAFVDEAVERGSTAIKNAVRAVHVIREELNAVLKTDFGGKRIRFIGDCIHGVIGKGTRVVDDPVDAIADTALCASAMRSSFGLCQEVLGGLDSLDLAVGIEFGPIPVTRIGKRGDESVRCAAGRAVVMSERMQQSIEAGGVKLGPVANQYASQTIRKLYASAARIPSFGAAADLLSSPASPAVQVVKQDTTARPYAR